MRFLRGARTNFEIIGSESDYYYEILPDHDLSALYNFLTRFLRQQRRPIRTCVDGGANIGLASLLMSELLPDAHISAFEPTARTFEYLVENIRRNRCEARISAHALALGRDVGSIDLLEDNFNSAANRLAPDGKGTPVPVTAIDSFFETAPEIDFLKIEVEGFEDQVLEGARRTLFKSRPIVFVEFNPGIIIQYGKQTPEQFMQKLTNILGQLGVVDRLSGEVTLLPANPVSAVESLNRLASSHLDVFDLVNCAP
jgi:FkbM family methyltransferase